MAKDLKANVVLGGRTTAGFDGLAGKIMGLGQVVDMVGSHIREWEKESVETYKNYETYMLEAKGAMSANYESATQLEKAYNGLQQKAQEWAASSIFHTNDVAKAISEAAHAGWEYNEMLEGIPRAMVLAQAGNIDLSSGLDMLIKTINGTGIAFTESGRFVDEWVMAANSSATTVSELGEAMERMGATARFGDSTGELLTMLAVLAGTGTVGAQAGTLLRNSMIRLIAPTKAARDTMAGLGLTAEDVQEAVGSDSETLKEVNALLEEAGFSAYTTSGKLKPFLQTFKDLDKATKNMTEEKRNKVLSAIFPTRTITGALALLEAAADNYDGLLERITGSEGYAAQVAETQTSGLMGKQELFLSKWEEFSRKVGEVVSDPLGRIYESVGGIVDTLNGMDSVALSGLVGGLSAIAEFGPALMTAGLAMRMFSWIGKGGLIFLGTAIAAGTLLGTLREINQLALENNFGNMSLDMGKIGKGLEEAASPVAQALADMNEYRSALAELQADYMSTGELLSEGLTSYMISGTKISKEDKEKFIQYGKDLIQNVKDGITIETAKEMDIASLIFSSGTGKESEGDLANNPVYASIITVLNAGMEGAIAEAEELSGKLKDALTSAFKDGVIDPEELANVQSYFDQLNELEAAFGPDAIERKKLLLKSQRVSLDAAKALGEEINNSETAALANWDDEVLEFQAQVLNKWEYAKKHGLEINDPNHPGESILASDVAIEDLIDYTNREAAKKRAAFTLQYDEMRMRGFVNALDTSDTGEMFKQAQTYLEQAQMGLITFAQAEKNIADMQGDGQLLARSMDTLIDSYFGDVEAMRQKAATYREAGGADNLAMADWLESMVYMREAFGGKINNAPQDAQSPEREGARGMIGYLDDMYRAGATDDEVLAYYNALTDVQRKAWDDNVEALKKDYNLADLAREYDQNGGIGLSDQVLDWLGAYLISQGIAKVPDEYKWSEYEGGPEGYATQAQQEALLANIQSKTSELQSAQANLEKLRARQETMAATIQERQDWQEHYFSNRARQEAGISDEAYEAYKQKTAELSEEKIKLDADVTAAEEKVATLGTDLEELTGEPVLLDLDTTQAEAAISSVSEKIDALGTQKPVVVIELDSEKVDSWEKEDTLSTHHIDYDDPGWTAPGDSSSTHTIYIQTKNVGSSGGFMSRFASTLGGFAEGGRADEPSIFAEAGAEWAIPEEHSQRTAELLNAAREASGFSWRELIAQNGGLNAGASGRDVNVTIQSYAPVINARDASGVAEELERDKTRLSEIVKQAVRTAIDDMNMMRGIEVYA